MKLSEQELIERISRRTLIREEVVRKVIEELKVAVEDAVLRDGKSLNLRGLGTFKPVKRRIGGKIIKHISFTTARALKDWYREYA